MTKITTKAEMVSWANRVNVSAHSSKQVCDLQDEFGHSSYNELVRIYNEELSADRPLVTFAINKCMGADTFEKFIRDWVAFKLTKEKIKIYESLEKELEGERMDVANMRTELLQREMDYKNRITNLQGDVDKLTRELNSARSYSTELHNELREARENTEKATKYDALRGLLS